MQFYYISHLQETFAEIKETIVALSEADMITLHPFILQSNHYNLLQFLIMKIQHMHTPTYAQINFTWTH